MLFPILIWLWDPFATSLEDNTKCETRAFDNQESKKKEKVISNFSKRSKFVNFYTAPVTQFLMDFLLYVIMLVLYTYVCLIPFERNLDFSEWLLLYWFTAMVVVEVKQMVHFTPREYFKSFWNFNDLLIIALYFWSFFFRIISTEKTRYEYDSKTVLGMNAIPVYLRLVRFYAVSKNLGPKIGLSDTIHIRIQIDILIHEKRI